jgi:hypothetical protein
MLFELMLVGAAGFGIHKWIKSQEKNDKQPRKYNDVNLTIKLDINSYNDYQGAIRQLNELKEYKRVTDDKTMPILLDAIDQLQSAISEHEKKHPGINQRVQIQNDNFKKSVSSFETSFSSGKLNKHYFKTYRDVYDQFDFSYKLRIGYIDGDGKSTKRDITVNSVEMYNGDGSLGAYCHLRKGQRTFKMDRITECVDLETGEFIDDVYKYLKSKYEQSPDKTLRDFAQNQQDILRVLEYIARADGQFRKEERLLIYDALRKLANDDRITDDMFKNAMEYTDSMSAQAYKLAITRLSSKSDHIKQIINNTAKAIVATQKTVHSSEQEALDYITKKWGI